jgi:hypothetical protein
MPGKKEHYILRTETPLLLKNFFLSLFFFVSLLLCVCISYFFPSFFLGFFLLISFFHRDRNTLSKNWSIPVKRARAVRRKRVDGNCCRASREG